MASLVEALKVGKGLTQFQGGMAHVGALLIQPCVQLSQPTTMVPFPTGSVLIVDDFAHWRAKVRNLLQDCRELHIVAEACDGSEAVRRAADLNPDLILLDIGMPILNGLAAAHEIRQVSPRTKVVFVTQENDADTRSAALAAGASGYVLKMNAESELLPTIETVLRNHQGTP